MKVSMIGTGNMARGIGTRLISGGHDVVFIGRGANEAEEAVAAVKDAGSGAASKGTMSDELGEVVVLAVPFGANVDLVKELGSRLAGKVVIDIANPLKPTFDGLATASDSSSAEEVAKAAVKEARVVKAFNTTFAGALMSGKAGGLPLDVFIAGDDESAKNTVSQLANDGGMRAVDVGPLAFSRYLEGIQFLHIALQGSLGTNWVSGLKIVS